MTSPSRQHSGISLHTHAVCIHTPLYLRKGQRNAEIRLKQIPSQTSVRFLSPVLRYKPGADPSVLAGGESSRALRGFRPADPGFHSACRAVYLSEEEPLR